MSELPTKKQLELIKHIECYVCPKFKGKTKQDAGQYIAKYVDEALLDKDLEEAMEATTNFN